MATIMWRMGGMDLFHDFIPDGFAIAAIVVWFAVLVLDKICTAYAHATLEKRHNAVMDRHGTDASFSLGACDIKIPLPYMYVFDL